MPAHPTFLNKIQTLAVFAALKTTHRHLDRGYSLADTASFMQDHVSARREWRVASYQDYRRVRDHWNPSRAAGWVDDIVPADAARRQARPMLGNHRRANPRALEPATAWQGGHVQGAALSSAARHAPTRQSTRPVTGSEWSRYLAPGTAFDLLVQELFARNQGLELMFVRRAGDLPHLERIEMGMYDRWQTIWQSA
ncbi:hypothetical protein [Xylophilus sp.]|uniref:hypothetical protein n=1 Tax=Xylophilus sp. TaxID=2653893 RepID=UPI0013BC4479|nr:hypothetical protein [Xylophilus sp.]KAF1043674.1 MAG: hypothetical protein GAK38_03858 [Xylophilus sp.]